MYYSRLVEPLELPGSAGLALPLFAHLGLVTVDLAPKPALGAWDSVFVRRWVGD